MVRQWIHVLDQSTVAFVWISLFLHVVTPDLAFDSRLVFRVCREETEKNRFFGSTDDALHAMFLSLVLRPRCSASWPVWLISTVMPRHSCAWLVLLVRRTSRHVPFFVSVYSATLGPQWYMFMRQSTEWLYSRFFYVKRWITVPEVDSRLSGVSASHLFFAFA